jgi:hypothetical protein
MVVQPRRARWARFETRWLTVEKNLSALADLSGQWIDRVHARRPPRGVVLDVDSSVSPTHGEQEMSVWNGHYGRTCPEADLQAAAGSKRHFSLVKASLWAQFLPPSS